MIFYYYKSTLQHFRTLVPFPRRVLALRTVPTALDVGGVSSGWSTSVSARCDPIHMRMYVFFLATQKLHVSVFHTHSAKPWMLLPLEFGDSFRHSVLMAARNCFLEIHPILYGIIMSFLKGD